MTELAAWAVAGVLILFNAALAGSEMALVSLPAHRREALRERGSRGERAARLAADPDRYLSTVQIGITLVGFLASATAAVGSGDSLADALSFLGGAAEPVAVVLLTVTVAFVALVVGELAPKRIALSDPETWALRAAGPIDRLASLLGPAVWFVSRASDAVLFVLRAPRGRDSSMPLSAEEIEQFIRVQRGLSPAQQEVIGEALAVGDRRVRGVLVPRGEIVAFKATDSAVDVLQSALASGHTRFPVYDGDLDATIGVVHLADLMDTRATVGSLAQPAPSVPETATVLSTLRRLQGARRKLALVFDEHGGLEGIVTVEDLVEELVGEIYDERDRVQVPARRDTAGQLHVAGSLSLYDLDEYGVALPASSAATVGGFVLEQIGHLPTVGERVEAPPWLLEVTRCNATTVIEVVISQADAENESRG